MNQKKEADIYAVPNEAAAHPEIILDVRGQRILLTARDAVHLIQEVQGALGRAVETWIGNDGPSADIKR